MTPRLKDPASLADADLLLSSGLQRGVAYWPNPRRWRAPPELLEAVGEFLFERVERGHARSFDQLAPYCGMKLADLGAHAAATAGTEPPRAALVHRDVALHYHRDRQNPYPCRNLLVVFRDPGVTGGQLVLPEEGVAVGCGDGSLTMFDGQRLHGVTPLGGDGSRLGLTFYAPLAEGR